MKITPEMFGLTKEEVAKHEALDKRIAQARNRFGIDTTGYITVNVDGLERSIPVRLAHAAPELLEALRNLVALSRPHFSDSSQILALNLAEKAIADAENK